MLHLTELDLVRLRLVLTDFFEPFMMTQSRSGHSRLLLILALIALATASRFLPLPPNFTALGAIALFAGAVLPSLSVGILVVLSSMLISDLFLGFHSTLPFVYAALAATILLGRYLLQSRKVSAGSFFSATCGHGLLFYLVTNFGVWFSQALYPKTFAGLVSCYVAGLPFLGNTLGSTALFSALLFGGLWLAERGIPQIRRNTVPVQS